MQESGEMYLETIFILSKSNPEIHSIDVAHEMKFSKPSVSRALKILQKGGFIEIDGSNHILLTQKGREIAGKMYERHQVLTEFLKRIGVSEKTAEEDACKMEHVISEETIGVIKQNYFL